MSMWMCACVIDYVIPEANILKMNIRNYSFLIRASDLQASSLHIDRPCHGQHRSFWWRLLSTITTTNNNIPDVKVNHNHLQSNNLPAGDDHLEWGDSMCSGQLYPEVEWDRKLQILLNTQTLAKSRWKFAVCLNECRWRNKVSESTVNFWSQAGRQWKSITLSGTWTICLLFVIYLFSCCNVFTQACCF